MSSQIGPLLRGLRLEVGLTQEQLAQQAGLGVRTVQRLETGKPTDVRMGTVRQVAHALADTLGRDRDEVWQELLTAHRGQGEVSVPASPRPAPEEIHRPSTGPVPEPVRPGGRPTGGMLAEVADTLAHDVRSRWIREEEQRRIHDPFPLPVRWRSAPEGLLDHWDNISGVAPGPSSGPLSLDGDLAQITDIYRRIGSRRLVVLGRAGSGKTMLMLRFVLDYLGTRSSDDPVPVVFSIGSWDPAVTGLRDWLIDRLLRDHPNLAARTAGRSTLAAALVDAGWILPVLDGFDEIAVGLHRAALAELNAISLPLLLTSRTEQFADATAIGVLRKAAGIELTDLTTTDLAHYLPRTARPTGQGELPDRAATVWDPVLDELCDQPNSPAGINLTAVLRTPLMVLLARTLYSDTPGQDPADLLDTARFPTSEAIEEHLLADFVPTVYARHPPARPDAATLRPRRTWDAQRAQRYLGHLAGHLDRPGQRDRQDLAWWQLSSALSLPSRILAIVLACTAVMTGSTILATSALELTSINRPLNLSASLLGGLVLGLSTGLALGLLYGIAVVFGKEAFNPSRVRLKLPIGGRQKAGTPSRRLPTAFGAGLLVGLAAGLSYIPAHYVLLFPGVVDGAQLEIQAPVETVLIRSLLYASIYGTAGSLALGLMATLETPLDVGSAATPAGLLAINRNTVIRQALLVAPVITIAVAGTYQVLEGSSVQGLLGPPEVPWEWLARGGECGLAGTLSYVLAFTAWGQWVLFTRIALPLTGRLPWATMAFLDDAYHRGVLRQVGAVYQFRHARLQSHLSSVPHTSGHG
ncbi:helix-turn-helix domain-containing protein [Kitasatospora acidiphila]|uniref:Helix-turn-helix domain-containing protein n=1 Tax=Kitasatospora acidiphila TaxID=2567942 RepID=A0A540W3M9_9ACTN|nr:helix-turn-helix domain-containing protein [Kitasatospora acidiphila]TQF02954.1 helix-turn-helix domain-containing protein [Kitasatospora acidiphila]